MTLCYLGEEYLTLYCRVGLFHEESELREFGRFTASAQVCRDTAVRTGGVASVPGPLRCFIIVIVTPVLGDARRRRGGHRVASLAAQGHGVERRAGAFAPTVQVEYRSSAAAQRAPPTLFERGMVTTEVHAKGRGRVVSPARRRCPRGAALSCAGRSIDS